MWLVLSDDDDGDHRFVVDQWVKVMVMVMVLAQALALGNLPMGTLMGNRAQVQFSIFHLDPSSKKDRFDCSYCQFHRLDTPRWQRPFAWHPGCHH